MTRRSLNKSTPSQSSSDTVHVPRTFIDDWSIKEKLLLASLAIEHKESWLAVRSSMRSFMESDRPTDILHNQCAAQYERLKEEEPELAQSLRGRSKRHSQTADPTIYRLEIYRKLAERRIEELKKSLPDKRDKLFSIKSDLDLIKSGEATPEDRARIEQRVEQMKKEAEEARIKHAAMLEKKKEEYENSKRLRTSRTKTVSETGSTHGETSIIESDSNKTLDRQPAEKQDNDKTLTSIPYAENNKSVDSENQDIATNYEFKTKSKADSIDKHDKKKETQDKDRPETRARQTEESDRETRKTRETTRTSRANTDRKSTTADSTKDDVKDDSKVPRAIADIKREVKEASAEKSESSTKSFDATPTRATTRRESSRQQSESNKQKVKRIMAMIFRDTKQHENIKLLDRPSSQPDTENYNSVIYKPIDLAQIKKRMDTDLDNPIELQNDLLLMFQNACMFYPENHPTHQAAIKMRADLTPKWESAMSEFVPPQAQGKEASSQSKIRPRERRQGSMKGNISIGKSSGTD